MATTTRRGTWVAPSHRVTWTPPGCEHSHRFYGRTDARVLAVPVELCDELATEPAVFAMSAVLREVVVALTERRTLRPRAEMHLLQVVADELADIEQTGDDSLYLLEPRDDRLRVVTEALHADPAQSTGLAELGRAAGASDRTLSRLFQKELGMSFLRWRTTLRIHHALVHLAAGRSVIDTATLCGWSTPSSFIEAFTDVVGQTPGRYQTQLRGERVQRDAAIVNQ